MSHPLTPQSLKRKLQQTLQDDLNNEDISANSSISNNLSVSSGSNCDISSHRSPPTELFLPTDYQMKSSPIRMTLHSSPTRSIKAGQSPRISVNSMNSFQMEQLQKLFSKRPSPFPVDLLKPTVLAEFFLKGRALERYFQHRYDGFKQTQTENIKEFDNFGLKPLQRPFVRSSPPSVPFSVYLERLFKYCHPEPLHLIAIVAYSERLIKTHKIYVPLQGIHRFAVAAWIVDGKALLGDQYWTNQYWSRVAGISVVEICSLEHELILLLQWRLQVPLDELTAAWYLLQLIL